MNNPDLDILFGDLPEAIANARCELLEQRRRVRHLESALASFSVEIEAQVAFDSEAKNDAQRKVKRAELMAAEDYQGLMLDLQCAKDEFEAIEIRIELLRNRFSVEKLEKREEIAEMEAAA